MRLPDPNAQGPFLRRVKEVLERWTQAQRFLSAYDVAGGRVVPTSWVDMLFDSADIAGEGLSLANGVVIFQKSGWYSVQYDATCQCSSTTGYYTAFRLMKDVGNGWSEVPGSMAYGYCRTTVIPYGACSCSRLMMVKANTKMKVQAMSTHDTEVITTKNACRLTVESKIYGD